MGCYNTILVPCPKCGEEYGCQTKSGDCSLSEFSLSSAPVDDMADVNRHAPFTCECGTVFEVAVEYGTEKKWVELPTVKSAKAVAIQGLGNQVAR